MYFAGVFRPEGLVGTFFAACLQSLIGLQLAQRMIMSEREGEVKLFCLILAVCLVAVIPRMAGPITVLQAQPDKPVVFV